MGKVRFDLDNSVNAQGQWISQRISASGCSPLPFFPWVGGKRRLIPIITKYLPEKIDKYYDPFVGGGAMFYYLRGRIRQAVLSDMNEHLINLYKQVRFNPLRMIDLLEVMPVNETKFYEIRDNFPGEGKSGDVLAAEFWYLLQYCYNALYREKDGKSTCTYGFKVRDKAITRDKAQLILSCSKALSKTQLIVRDFRDVNPQPGSFVYLDPPYYNASKTYKAEFGHNDSADLASKCREWDNRGVLWMMSNNNEQGIKDLMQGFNIHVIKVPRMDIARGGDLGIVEEVVVTNYDSKPNRGIQRLI